MIHLQPLLRVRPQPLVTNPPPFILDSQHSTLNIIDKVEVICLLRQNNRSKMIAEPLQNMFTFSSELAPACKLLYETVRSCKLDFEFELGVSEVSRYVAAM